jgi:periplasmic protein TonB
MFRENLLESAPSGRKRKRWPIALAFSAEMVVGALLVALPLLSTGVISVSAHPQPISLNAVKVVRVRPTSSAGDTSGSIAPRRAVVTLLATNTKAPFFGPRRPDSYSDDPSPDTAISGNDKLPSDIVGDGKDHAPKLDSKHPPISVLSEAQLLTKVEPAYPHIAIVTGTQGEVRLHAIIAKDGSIESLSVISGHPILVGAAVAAVRQWRYRPYYLNGQAVEVETFITVNFKKTKE